MMRCQIPNASIFVGMEPLQCSRTSNVFSKVEVTRGKDLYHRKFIICQSCITGNMPILAAGVKKKGLPDAPHSVTEIVKDGG